MHLHEREHFKGSKIRRKKKWEHVNSLTLVYYSELNWLFLYSFSQFNNSNNFNLNQSVFMHVCV